ncbi:TetR/AcrR family transcriptional regulator [Kineosporia babensis]|uniref:TetR/AcrR family transcriptional regulator n=1 Tax=Kineosporia babensis TaxID=499548 RepID=A0A9X1NBN0_9ACTN|nr:TetR/AcrR family transcriptional regulator [Kineosporia babensis]MCD5310725.1 TetR/AcrR family transcriptional regulator [Kineosporia babensis]
MLITSGPDPDTTAKTGYARGRVKRRQILEAATAVFADVGFNGASLREIAARAGISHPGLLHHFPTKPALLEAVLKHRDEVDTTAFDADIARGVSKFEALLLLAERNQQRRPLVELFMAVGAEATSPAHPAHEYFVNRYEQAVSFFREWFESEELRAGLQPEDAARHMVALMDGLQVQWLMSLGGPPEREVDMAACLRSYLHLVLPA